MQTQHISDVYPNIISITKIRQDIDALLDLLEQYKEVKVLRGQNILFTAVRADISRVNKDKIKKAVEFANKIAKRYKVKKGQISGSDWVIREREKTRKKNYYEEYCR